MVFSSKYTPEPVRNAWNRLRRVTLTAAVPAEIRVRDRLSAVPLGKKRLSEVTLSALCPVFVLSTGRTGTTSLSVLLDQSERIRATHQPFPQLLAPTYAAYQQIGAFRDDRFLAEVIYLARHRVISRAHAEGQTYFESSNRMTYIARGIRTLYPGAKFIVVPRNPADFIVSALRRGYYSSHPWDPARIHPREGTEMAARWPGLGFVEKCSWLWAETYRAALTDIEDVPEEQKWILPAEQLFAWDDELIAKLFHFVAGVEPPPRATVEAIMGQRLNAQVRGQARAPSEWTLTEKQFFDEVVGPTARLFGY